MKKYVCLLALALLVWNLKAQCLTPLEVESEFETNPVEEINGVFKFDYKITSEVAYSSDGTAERLKMDYYVNTADGSILLPSGPMGFFKANTGRYRSDDGRIDGAIWLSNGQMVTYVFDAKNSIKRAITTQTTQTTDDVFTDKYLNMMQFFASSEEMAEHPEPLPADFAWTGVTRGYKGELKESTGITNTWTVYFDEAPTPIKTSTVMVGFMVGVLKDVRELKCNRLAVYTKINIGGVDTGNYMEARLKSIKPFGITFDASDYKPMTLGGTRGTDIRATMAAFEGRMLEIHNRRQHLKNQRRLCRDKVCRERWDRELDRLKEDEDRLNCEIARAMGVEDTLEECGR